MILKTDSFSTFQCYLRIWKLFRQSSCKRRSNTEILRMIQLRMEREIQRENCFGKYIYLILSFIQHMIADISFAPREQKTLYEDIEQFFLPIKYLDI